MIPIPPLQDDLQYRALGLVRGVLRPLSRHYQAVLVTEDRQEYPVTPGRLAVMEGFQFCLKTARPHWFFVQPQPRPGRTLGLSIIQVLSVSSGDMDLNEPFASAPDDTEEGFHLRGLVEPAANHIMVTIKRKPQGTKQFPPLVLTVEGFLPQAKAGEFWDLVLERDGHDLVLVDGTRILAAA